MKSYTDFLPKEKLQFVFTDIDDTLTEEGRLPANAYESLWQLYEKGLHIVPITGRPAGWCEMIARMWPVSGVIGENGALYFRYIDKTMKRHYVYEQNTIAKNRSKLNLIEQEVLQQVPGAAIASDQFCRLFDLAIDFCEDVPTLPKQDIEKIVDIFKKKGAVAKVSSIHVNGWFGNYDKLTMCQTFLKNEFNTTLEQAQTYSLFVGDSPNDEPMFGKFENSFAVSNIKSFSNELKQKPKYVMSLPGGQGFTQLTQHLLKYL